jgi:ABC-type Na+ transport system ATPase subunit NatA
MPSGTTEAATLEAISDNVIEVKNPTKYYSDLVTVDHTSFVVHRDEVFGFLGSNGTDKTTTQWVLTTPLEPTDGCILING